MKGRKSDDNLNLLVLDDLLISLDMHNRKKVIEMIIKEYSTDYQIIIFTHDKGFYNEVVRTLNDKKNDWQFIQMYETAIAKNPEIKYDNAGNLDKALDFFVRHDYEACALYLRKEVEEVLAKFIDPELSFIWKQKEWKGLSDFITSAEKKLVEKRYQDFKKILDFSITTDFLEKLKGQIEADSDFVGHPEILGPLITYKKRIFEFIKNIKIENEKKEDIVLLMNQIENIKDRTLNPGAHFTEAPFFKEEIEFAIYVVVEMKKVIANQNMDEYKRKCAELGIQFPN